MMQNEETIEGALKVNNSIMEANAGSKSSRNAMPHHQKLLQQIAILVETTKTKNFHFISIVGRETILISSVGENLI